MAKKHPPGLPIIVGDVVRFMADLVIHALTLLPAALVFLLLWDIGSFWACLLAFPAAWVVMAGAFPVVIIVIGLLFVRRVREGCYNIRRPEALRWIVAESLMLIVHRSFLRGYLDDFGPQRYLFYRLMGAKIDRTFFLGGEARILDPWALEVGSNVIIGAFSVICGHSIEGHELTVKPVVVHDGATIGVRSVILPGVEIGANAIVGAGALVTKDTVIPGGEVWAGVPARKIGVVGERESQEALPDQR